MGDAPGDRPGPGPVRRARPWRAQQAVHDPGKIIADLPAAVALGGDCLADIAMLREQPELAGPVASDLVVSRLIAALLIKQPLSAISQMRWQAGSRCCECHRYKARSSFPITGEHPYPGRAQ